MSNVARITTQSSVFIQLGLAICVVSLAVGCAPTKTTDEGSPKSGAPGSIKVVNESITYAMPNTVAAIPAYVALEKGFWKDQGLDVKAQMFSAGRLALDALLGKSAEVMSVSETPLVNAILQKRGIYVVATVTRHKEVKAIGRRDLGIVDAKSFRGKRIATLPGTNSDYYLYRFLESAGIPKSSVKITNMKPPEMVTSLLSGKIDGYFAWEPHVYFAQSRLASKAVIFPAGDLYDGRHCVAMNQDYVKAHPGVVEKLIRGLIKAEEFVKLNEDEAMRIVAKRTGMKADALRSLWGEYQVVVELDDAPVRIMTAEAKWIAANAKPVVQLPNFRDFFYTNGLSNVRPESMRLK